MDNTHGEKLNEILSRSLVIEEFEKKHNLTKANQ